jgi:hypothetical protein
MVELVEVVRSIATLTSMMCCLSQMYPSIGRVGRSSVEPSDHGDVSGPVDGCLGGHVDWFDASTMCDSNALLLDLTTTSVLPQDPLAGARDCRDAQS